ncbi:hypothetical protein CLV78_101678 [Aliiruegeria haliotis]|uniref:Subtilase family protein n=1 Tax=Aliiruegeria haliotis TaxID=1280846 RepID=A0A2T0RZH1_9RHOB|nr:hypothetical protein [Aliiruegeria haliotis]PRY26578.1 hypothetical protein CLV78_101678 [Aliiruegeria haliotis]
MTLTWQGPRSQNGLEGVQHPIQHWILAPDPLPATSGSGAEADGTVLAHVFRFNSSRDMFAFKAAFPPREDSVPTGGTSRLASGAVFPEVGPMLLPDEQLLTTGFARFDEARAMHDALKDKGWGDMLLAGLPVPAPPLSGIISALEAVVPPRPALGQGRPVHVLLDTAIAFANARFLDADGKTRIVEFWDQSALPDKGDPRFLGRLTSGREIDAMRKDHSQAGNVDDWGLYAAYDAMAYGPGSERRLPAATGHGTHVLDTLCGGPSEASQIVAVELPQASVDATHGGMLAPSVLLTLQWMNTWNLTPPPMLNYSFGGIAGRHDGEGLLESLFDLAVKNGTASAITLPAGNSFATQTHAQFTHADLATPRELVWNIQPDDGTPSFLEIWLPRCRHRRGDGQPDDKATISLTVTPPCGGGRSFTDLDYGVHELLDGGDVVARLYIICTHPILGGRKRPLMLLAVRHTALGRSHFGHRGGKPELAGDWALEFSAIDLPDGDTVDVWIERDDPLGRARTGARQSYFTAPRPVWPQEAPKSPVVGNAGTISDIATGKRTLVAAGHSLVDRQPASYSSEGFVPKPRARPTASAGCEFSPARPGLLGAGFFSGSTYPMGGTSTACAVVGRIAATLAQKGQKPTRAEVAARAALDDPRTHPANDRLDLRFDRYDGPPPRTRVGAGCLNLPADLLRRNDVDR